MFWKKNIHEEVRQGIKTLYPRLWRYCMVLTGSKTHSDDLAQMTCLRALEKADLYQSGTRLDSWIFKIAQRIWINELRKQAVRVGGGLVPVEEVELPDNKSDPETNYFVHEVLSEVMTLPEAQRIAVTLVYVEGYSYKETAGMLEIPIGTVMSRLAAARSKLTSKINNERHAV